MDGVIKLMTLLLFVEYLRHLAKFGICLQAHRAEHKPNTVSVDTNTFGVTVYKHNYWVGETFILKVLLNIFLKYTQKRIHSFCFKVRAMCKRDG